MKTYAEKLKDPRWQKKRLEILQRDKFECRFCSASDKELHVHHAFYMRGRQPWEYENTDLSTLCLDCHEELEKLKRTIGYQTSWPDYYAAYLDLSELLSPPEDNNQPIPSDSYQLINTIISVLRRSPRLLRPVYDLLTDRFKEYPQKSTTKSEDEIPTEIVK